MNKLSRWVFRTITGHIVARCVMTMTDDDSISYLTEDGWIIRKVMHNGKIWSLDMHQILGLDLSEKEDIFFSRYKSSVLVGAAGVHDRDVTYTLYRLNDMGECDDVGSFQIPRTKRKMKVSWKVGSLLNFVLHTKKNKWTVSKVGTKLNVTKDKKRPVVT